MTSRELTDEIEVLVQAKIAYHFAFTAGQADIIASLKDTIEGSKRRISDGFKRLDHKPGVAVMGKND